MTIPADRNPFDQAMDFCRSFAAFSATRTSQVITLKRAFRVSLVELITDADTTTDDTDYYVFQVKHGATVIATWSTKTTGGQGAALAAAPNVMVLSADANLVIPIGDVLQLTGTKNGSAANMTLSIAVHGRYL